jgi:hypothetical protein
VGGCSGDQAGGSRKLQGVADSSHESETCEKPKKKALKRGFQGRKLVAGAGFVPQHAEILSPFSHFSSLFGYTPSLDMSHRDSMGSGVFNEGCCSFPPRWALMIRVTTVRHASVPLTGLLLKAMPVKQLMRRSRRIDSQNS